MLAILCFVLILEAFMLATSFIKFYNPDSRLNPVAAKIVPAAQLLACVGIGVAIWLLQDVNNHQKLAVPFLLYVISSIVATEVSLCLLGLLI
jgi:hypothetical protein